MGPTSLGGRHKTSIGAHEFSLTASESGSSHSMIPHAPRRWMTDIYTASFRTEDLLSAPVPLKLLMGVILDRRTTITPRGELERQRELHREIESLLGGEAR